MREINRDGGRRDACSIMEMRADHTGPCVVCLYSCSIDSHLLTEQKMKIRYTLAARSRVFNVVPTPLPCKFTVSQPTAKIYDQVKFKFRSLQPCLYETTRYHGHGVITVSGPNSEKETYANISEFGDHHVKGTVNVTVMPEDFGTLAVRIISDSGLEEFVGENGEKEMHIEIINDRLIDDKNDVVLEVPSYDLVPVQKVQITYDFKDNVLGNTTMIAWFEVGKISANDIKGAAGMITTNSGTIEGYAPAVPGEYTLRFMRYTSAGEIQFIGDTPPIHVSIKRNIPVVFKSPAEVFEGENFTIEVELEGNPVLMADFVQVLKEGATNPVAGERITTPKTKVVATAGFPGRYIVRYGSILPGTTTITVATWNLLTVLPRHSVPPADAPAAAAAASAPAASASEPVEITAKTWLEFLAMCEIDEKDAPAIASIFEENEMSVSQAVDLDMEVLKELGIKMGPRLKIMKFLKKK